MQMEDDIWVPGVPGAFFAFAGASESVRSGAVQAGVA